MVWKFDADGGCITFRDETRGWVVSLRSGQDAGAIVRRDEAGFFPLWLYEWTDYWLECRCVDGHPVAFTATFGGEPAADGPTPNLKRYVYQNRVGHSHINVVVDGGSLPPLDVEVISRKLDKPIGDPLHYPTFYNNLRSDIHRRLASLPFVFSAPTFHCVEETSEPPTPLFLFWFLKQHGARLRSAVSAILANPHRRLTHEEDFLPISQAFEVTPRTLQAIVEHPEYLHQLTNPPTHQLTPSHVLQSLLTDTFDTPENCFVKHFLSTLLATQYAIRNTQYAIRNTDLDDPLGFLQLALRASFLEEVSEMLYFPAASPVLLKRDGYRELLQLWREFNLARQPTFFRDVQDAMDARDVATMYEYWCFFELAERLSFISPFALRLSPSADEGLAWNVAAIFGDTDYRLVYNRPFARGQGSYSLGLRPDFSLFRGDALQVVFDAKFRFDERDAEELGRREEAEDAGMQGDAERLAKRADLYKMHTYRDALRCRAAVALFPATSASDRMYLTDGAARRGFALAELVNSEVEGVGMMGFVPLNLSL